jgi:hypothetical protein
VTPFDVPSPFRVPLLLKRADGLDGPEGDFMIETVWGSTDKPVASAQLAEILSAQAGLTGTLYIGYPIIGTPEGSFPIDALLASPTKGLVLINLVEGRTLPDYAQLQDDAYNKMLKALSKITQMKW